MALISWARTSALYPVLLKHSRSRHAACLNTGRRRLESVWGISYIESITQLRTSTYFAQVQALERTTKRLMQQIAAQEAELAKAIKLLRGIDRKMALARRYLQAQDQL